APLERFDFGDGFSGGVFAEVFGDFHCVGGVSRDWSRGAARESSRQLDELAVFANLFLERFARGFSVHVQFHSVGSCRRRMFSNCVCRAGRRQCWSSRRKLPSLRSWTSTLFNDRQRLAGAGAAYQSGSTPPGATRKAPLR